MQILNVKQFNGDQPFTSSVVTSKCEYCQYIFVYNSPWETIKEHEWFNQNQRCVKCGGSCSEPPPTMTDDQILEFLSTHVYADDKATHFAVKNFVDKAVKNVNSPC